MTAWDQEHAVTERVEELLGEVSSMFILNFVHKMWESRMKDLAAVVLEPGSKKTITEYNGGLSALDYIWNLHGDYSWSSEQEREPKWRALDYYLGRKVEHIWGTGVIVKRKCGQYAIKVRLRCSADKCRNTITAYAVPGCHNGAFCYVEDIDGNYQADLRNQSFMCKWHR